MPESIIHVHEMIKVISVLRTVHEANAQRCLLTSSQTVSHCGGGANTQLVGGAEDSPCLRARGQKETTGRRARPSERPGADQGAGEKENTCNVL